MKYKQLPNVTIKFVCIRVKAIIVDEIFHWILLLITLTFSIFYKVKTIMQILLLLWISPSPHLRI